jgi:hypothetical protein
LMLWAGALWMDFGDGLDERWTLVGDFWLAVVHGFVYYHGLMGTRAMASAQRAGDGALLLIPDGLSPSLQSSVCWSFYRRPAEDASPRRSARVLCRSWAGTWASWMVWIFGRQVF